MCVTLSICGDFGRTGWCQANFFLFLFSGRLSLWILVEPSKSHIAGSVLCASETRIRATRLEFGSFATKSLEFGWIDWEYCFRVEILAGLWMAPSQFVEG